MSRSRIVWTTAWLVAVLGAPAQAFHDGGVARCDGCHVMHQGDVIPGPGGEGALLLDISPSDVCLNCHAGAAGSVMGSDPLAPPPERGAGNFVFLLEDNLNDLVDGQANPIPGEAAGHSIVAPGRGLSQDSRYALAPGGTFPSSQLGCTSCHDPHGTVGFRLLYGVGTVESGPAFFTSPAPDALGLGLGGVETPTSHTAYRGGMSAWCGNCHGNYHQSGISGFEHGSDLNLGPGVSTQYNLYDGDDAPTAGSFASAYLPEVPFEDPGPATSQTSTQGPSSTSRVMCLSCHRAHASSAPAAGRWDFNISLLADDGLVSGSYPIPDPYNSPNQGSLCSKCHAAGGPPGPVPPGRGVIQPVTPPPTVNGPSGPRRALR
jgi:hypothetical protein